MSIQKAELNFSNKGLVLIQGINDDDDSFESNGAGKSTLFSEAPTWALTGKTVRGQKGDKVVNRNIGKDTSVSLEVVDDNGDVYTIIRHRKDTKHKNHVLLFKNDVNITGKSDADTDILIEDLIQMDYSTFTNSIMFGQGITKMFASSTDSEQKKILEKMLQIDIYKDCQERAKTLLEAVTKKSNEKELLITSKRNERKSLESTIEELQEKEDALEARVKHRIFELELEEEGYQTELDSLSEDTLLEDIELYTGLKVKLDTSISKFSDTEDIKKSLEIKKGTLKNTLVDEDRKLTKKNKELSDLKTGKNVPKSCRACGQDLPLNDTSHLENHLEDDIKNIEVKLSEIHAQIAETDIDLTDSTIALEGKKPLEKQLKDMEEIISDIKSEHKLMVSRKKEITIMLIRIRSQIKEQEEMLGTTYTNVIESSIAKAESLNEDIKIISEELEVLSNEIEDYEFWVKGFGNTGIKSVLLDSVVPFLNTRANYYLTKLSGSTIQVLFNTQTELVSGEKRDKFSVEVINANGDNDYSGNSNGEKRRIDIAINMALQDLVASRSNKNIDLIVYDEIYEGLDSVGCESVIELLEEKARQVGTIFVITHNDNLKQLFTQSLTVTKSDGRTVIAS